jgi:competence protein ComEC
MGFLSRIATLLDAERDRWILLPPVFFGAGVAAYFLLNIEPEGWVGPICTFTALSAAIYYRHIQAVTFAMLACALFSAGFSNVKFQSDRIEAPILSEPLGSGILYGRILRIEAFPKRPRVLLDHLT